MDALQGILGKSGSANSLRAAQPEASRARDAARTPVSPEVEISPAARERQALVRRSAPAAVSAASELPPRPADALESADSGERSDRPARAADRADREEQRRSSEREQERSFGTSPVLAVRVGVPPIGQIGNAPSAPNAAEAALRERAVLRDIGQVLSLPATGNKRELERTARKGEGDKTEEDSTAPEDLALIGSAQGDGAPHAEPARSSDRPPATARAVEFAARDLRIERPAPPPVRQSSSEESRLLELVGQQPLGEPELREVSAVIGGSGSGAVRDPNEAARQIPLPGDGSRAEQSAGQVQSVTTQFSVIEAQATDELVTRFLGSSPPEDPGPEPRFREPLTP